MSKDKLPKAKEFYKVHLLSERYSGEEASLYVIARSAREAERRALVIGRGSGDFSVKRSVYAKEVSFIGYVR